MARQEHDREDLLREATALVERVELQIPREPEPIVVGFRHDGAFSVYFGGDPVYQFNSAGQLRRAFIDGMMYKAEQGQLIALHRRRDLTGIALIRDSLTVDQQTGILARAHEQLQELRAALTRKTFAIAGQVPPDTDVVGRAETWLAGLSSAIVVADRPNVG